MISLIIIGAGGFGRETLDVVRSLNRSSSSPVYDLLGVVDSQPSEANLSRLDALGVRFLGSESDWIASSRLAQYLVGVGSPKIRRQIAHRFDSAGYRAATVVHPTAVVGSNSTLSAGSVVCAGAQISTNVVIGAHAHINPNATVGHDAVLKDFVSLNPGSVVSGEVVCETEVLVGAGAVVLQGLTLGARSLVGAAACVTRSLTADTIAKGVPARPYRPDGAPS
ncbi:acetyltransferase [Pseudarthrobacter oxydans]|uniref:acetyltransferase n=1 Tax=Pseudarthrobacter oxydans TaxID=1671 RepID=UPI003ED14500